MKVAGSLTWVLVLALTSVGRADDSKQDSLTLLPWTDASLVFASEGQRARVHYSHLFRGGFGFGVDASAPLDEDTRIAAFDGVGGGFKGNLQLGWDRRSRRLYRLLDLMQGFVAAREVIVKVEWLHPELKAAFVKKNGVSPDDTSILKYFAAKLLPPAPGPEGAPAVAAAPDVARVREAMCTQYFGESCDTPGDERTSKQRFVVVANKFLEQPCTGSRAIEADCFAARWMLNVLALEDAASTLVKDAGIARQTWQLLLDLAPDEADKIKQQYQDRTGAKDPPLDSQIAVLYADEILKVARQLVHRAALERRDLLLTGQALGDDWAASVMLDVSLTFDRQEVFQGDPAFKPEDTSSYDLELGVSGSVTPGSGLTFTLRTGLERKRESGAEPFERCTITGSIVLGVTGEICDSKALFRWGVQPDAETSFYLRGAVTYQYQGELSRDDLTPGVELRAGLEGVGAYKAAEVRLALFGTPVKGNTAARVGVALLTSYAINREDSSVSRWAFTPMAFFGATIADLMNTR